MNAASQLINSFLNLIYPLHCASCGKSLKVADQTGACEICIARIKPNPRPYCRRCGRPMPEAGVSCPECLEMRPYFSSACSACLYEDPLKELIHKFKYNNRRSLANIFSRIMADFICDNPEIIDGVDTITFVPLSKKRSLERTFNQSELLASAIGKAFEIPVKGCLRKKLPTKNQNELSRQDRLVNVKEAFSLKNGMDETVRDADVLLIDDVMTTGATLNDSSRALIQAGARRVRCLTLARGN